MARASRLPWPDDMPALRPCPFCGGEAELRGGSSTTTYIRCRICGCRTGNRGNLGDLASVWNNRVEDKLDDRLIGRR